MSTHPQPLPSHPKTRDYAPSRLPITSGHGSRPPLAAPPRSSNWASGPAGLRTRCTQRLPAGLVLASESSAGSVSASSPHTESTARPLTRNGGRNRKFSLQWLNLTDSPNLRTQPRHGRSRKRKLRHCLCRSSVRRLGASGREWFWSSCGSACPW